MNRGRPRQEAPDGYLTVREAADALGVTEGAIRGRMDRGTLEYETHQLENREVRIYIPRDAIKRVLAEKNLPATKSDTGEVALRVDKNTEALVRRLEAVSEAIKGQEANLSGKLGRLEENQREIRAALERAMEIMLNAAQHEKEYQRRVLELMEKVEEVEEKRKPWWSRWFGG